MEAWLRLTLIPGVGPATLRKLLARLPSPLDVLAAPTSTLIALVGSKVCAAILNGADGASVSRALEWLKDSNNHLVTLADETYPALLLETPDPPAVLFITGNPKLLANPSLAMVGARNATPSGIANAESFACELSDAGLTIVSGLAVGIDSAAHRGALKGTSSTIAVVGTGLDRVYPARNRDLAHQISELGALVSEFPLGTPPLASNFPRRNRVISGLARGCLIVEAALKSGSLITAYQALDQGREVFAIPGSIHSPLSRGCHKLIKRGAKLVESSQDILEELHVPGTSMVTHENPVPEKLIALLSIMGFEPFDLDILCDRSGLTPNAAYAILLELEMTGYVSRLPGGLLQRLR